jgi:phage/plasmid-associated DNA primase
MTIPPADRDEHLPEKLKSELPGILAWMFEGCLDWQETSLA